MMRTLDVAGRAAAPREGRDGRVQAGVDHVPFAVGGVHQHVPGIKFGALDLPRRARARLEQRVDGVGLDLARRGRRRFQVRFALVAVALQVKYKNDGAAVFLTL